MNKNGMACLRRPLLLLAVSAAVTISLQGCVGLLVGGAVVGAAVTATDRRSVGAQADDAAIVLKAEASVSKITGDLGRVAVTSFNRQVLLTGEVRDEQMKAAVEKQVATVGTVKSIENDLVIGPVTGLSVRSNDALITGKVKAAIIDTKGLYLNAFKVHTDRGVVYLMGRVTQRESKMVTEVVRHSSSGITKIVRLFEYINEDEIKDYVVKPSSSK